MIRVDKINAVEDDDDGDDDGDDDNEINDNVATLCLT